MASEPAARSGHACAACGVARGAVRGSDGRIRCRACFVRWIEDSVLACVRSAALFAEGERVAVAISGGKDSTALAHVLTTINERAKLRLDLRLLCIDEGIGGYRDRSIETVHRNAAFYRLPLLVLPLDQLFGYTLDEVARRTADAATGTAHNTCSYCGVFRRQALDIGAEQLGCTKLATGHNADDAAETVLLNILRGDTARLGRCRSAHGGTEGGVPRVRPFQYVTQRDIVYYAHFCKLDYFAVECPYAAVAFRSHPRSLIKELEAVNPTAVLDIVRSGEMFDVPQQQQRTQKAKPAPTPQEQQEQLQPRTATENRFKPAVDGVQPCVRCGRMTSQKRCQACTLILKLQST